ncbi:MAG: hypothetical protein V3W04_06610 [Gammaproteobacteria bacterium]
MATQKDERTLAIQIHGGRVKSVITNVAGEIEPLNILVIDYDEHEYLHSELIPVMQKNDRVLPASCYLYPLESSDIDLQGIIETLLSRGET